MQAGRNILELDTLSFSETRDALPITELETAIMRGDFPERLAAASTAH